MAGKIVVVGGGQAAAQAIATLIQGRCESEITLISKEPYLPYQRPPLSKAYLKGEMARERLSLRPESFYRDHGIALRLGERVVKLEPNARTVGTSDGAEFEYDRLLLATGAPPRRLPVPGTDLDGVYYLRTIKDSDALREILSIDGRIVIVGAGYVGLEVAAVARSAGREVTVLEMADRVLARVASPPVSEFYEDLHRSAGVDLRTTESLKSIVGESGVEGVVLSNGEVLDCVSVLIGIGASPEIAIARAAGLDVDNGIVVDNCSRTSDASIWAAGDCTNFPSARYGIRVRLESVPNAIEQSKVAALSMQGKDAVYDPLPWFWSDQYDVKLQTVGLPAGYDRYVVRGDPATKKFTVWYFSSGKPISVDAINDPATFGVAKRILGSDALLDEDQVADVGFDLKRAINLVS